MKSSSTWHFLYVITILACFPFSKSLANSLEINMQNDTGSSVYIKQVGAENKSQITVGGERAQILETLTEIENSTQQNLPSAATAVITADGLPADNFARFEQSGQRNIISAIQSGKGNVLRIDQRGNNNKAGVAQIGNDNTTNLQQLFNNNTATIGVVGDNNSIDMITRGNSNFSLDHVGNNLSIKSNR